MLISIYYEIQAVFTPVTHFYINNSKVVKFI